MSRASKSQPCALCRITFLFCSLGKLPAAWPSAPLLLLINTFVKRTLDEQAHRFRFSPGLLTMTPGRGSNQTIKWWILRAGETFDSRNPNAEGCRDPGSSLSRRYTPPTPGSRLRVPGSHVLQGGWAPLHLYGKKEQWLHTGQESDSWFLHSVGVWL